MFKLLCSSLLLFFVAQQSFAQVTDGLPMDSTIIRFSNGMPNYVPDTAAAPVWQIGLTHKAFFVSDTLGTRAMMTDTLHNYPVNANNWFVIKVKYGFNTIIDFWHKYQADSTHDGGTVEFSVDHGTTWQSLVGACLANGSACTPGVKTTNFYADTDTLANGVPAFTGTQSVVQYSRFQFFEGCPVGPTSACTLTTDTFYVRFRFMSDTASDTLAGWRIDSMKVENDNYGGGVPEVSKYEHLKVYPNPTTDFSFQFPPLLKENEYNIQVFNVMGERVLSQPYSETLGLDGSARGVYFYRVTNGSNYYSGMLQVE